METDTATAKATDTATDKTSEMLTIADAMMQKITDSLVNISSGRAPAAMDYASHSTLLAQTAILRAMVEELRGLRQSLETIALKLPAPAPWSA